MSVKVEKTKNNNEVKLEITVEAAKFDEAIKTVFNKNAKYMKEEAQNLAAKKFEIENELELSKKNYKNKDKIIIKDLKKDIKLFKSKIIKMFILPQLSKIDFRFAFSRRFRLN